MGTSRSTRADAIVMMMVVGLVAVALLTAAVVDPDTSWGAAGTVQVTAVVRPGIQVNFHSDHVMVSSNIPWEASARMPDGSLWVIDGEQTEGCRIDLPEGATGIQVCAR